MPTYIGAWTARPITNTPLRSQVLRSTGCGVATNTPPPMCSGRSWVTTTARAPCTPKPDGRSGICFPTRSPTCWRAMPGVARRGPPHGGNTPRPCAPGGPRTNACAPQPHTAPSAASTPTDSIFDPHRSGPSRAPAAGDRAHARVVRVSQAAFDEPGVARVSGCQPTSDDHDADPLRAGAPQRERGGVSAGAAGPCVVEQQDVPSCEVNLRSEPEVARRDAVVVSRPQPRCQTGGLADRIYPQCDGGERVWPGSVLHRRDREPHIDGLSCLSLHASLVQRDAQVEQPVDNAGITGTRAAQRVVLVAAQHLRRLVALDAVDQRHHSLTESGHRVCPFTGQAPVTPADRCGADRAGDAGIADGVVQVGAGRLGEFVLGAPDRVGHLVHGCSVHARTVRSAIDRFRAAIPFPRAICTGADPLTAPYRPLSSLCVS